MVVDECAGEGEVPRRSGHSATALPDGRILVFGGVDETGAYRNDAFLVDPDRNRWLALKGGITRGAPPKPRAYHRCLNASPQDVQAYHVLQVDRRRPLAGCCLQTACPQPARRAFVLDATHLMWHPCHCSATLIGSRIIIVGGLGSRTWSCKEVAFDDQNVHAVPLFDLHHSIAGFYHMGCPQRYM